MKHPSKLGLGLLALLVGAAVACSSDDDAAPGGSSSSGGTSSSSGESSSSGGAASSSSSGNVSSSSSSGTGSSSGTNEESLQAIVTDLVLTQDDDCQLDLTLPKVDTPTDAADAKIKAAIPSTNADYCAPDAEMSFGGEYEVKANEWGVLSIALSHFSEYGSAGLDHFVEGHNFDIATGDSITFENLLDAAGIEKMRAKCIEVLSDPEENLDPDRRQEICAFAVDGFEGEGGGNIQIEKTGLRLYLGPEVLFPTALEGAVVSWADLGSTVTLPLVQRFVSKQ